MYCKIKIMSNLDFRYLYDELKAKNEVSLKDNTYTFFCFSSTSMLQSHLFSDSFKSYPLMKRALTLKNSGGTRLKKWNFLQASMEIHYVFPNFLNVTDVCFLSSIQ